MSAPVIPQPPLQMARLREAKDIDDVVRNLDQIIEWSIKAESHIGYFTVIYKRVTVAIREAINEGMFYNGSRIEQLDVAFGRRYFNALNAYFYPDTSQGLTLPWAVAFVGDQDDQAIILQYMLAGLNAHITFDLGLGLLAVAPNSLDTLTRDYQRVGALLCSQIPGIVKVVDQLSPELRRTRWLIPDEVGVLKGALKKLRKGAWLFAIYMAMHPQNATAKALHQEAWTAALSSWYLQPTERWTPFPRLIRAIAKHESDDVASNIRAFEDISNRPDKLNEAYL
jgi:Family of unknown function (DUF5995)